MTVGLFANSGSGDVWNGLALTDLNMNGFSITNINTATILQTDTTGQALDVSRNLAAANTDSSIVCFYNLNAGDDQPVLTVRTASNAAAANPMVIFESTDVLYDQPLFSIIQAGPAEGLLITQNGDAYGLSVVSIGGTGINAAIFAQANAGGYGISIEQAGDNYGLYIDHSVAATNTMYGIQVLGGAGATIANFEYSGNEFVRIGMNNDANGTSWFYRNLAAATTAGPVVRIEQSHADDDMGALYVVGDSDATGANPLVLFETTNAAFNQPVLSIINDGTDYGLEILSPNGYPAYIRSDASNYFQVGPAGGVATGMLYRDHPLATTAGPVLKVQNANAGDDRAALEVINAGAGRGSTFDQTGNNEAMRITHTDTGTTNTVYIDRDGNNAADIWAMRIDCDNAGAGAPGAIDMSSFAAGEALLNVPVDAGAVGAHYGRITVNVVGVGLKAIDLLEIA